MRDARFFARAKGVDARPGQQALAIDRARREVLVRELAGGAESRLPYDRLVLATGSRPFLPPVKGVDLAGVTPVADLHHAAAIKELAAKGAMESVAIVGGGAIGLEMAEALSDLWGLTVHVCELADQILPGVLEPELARMLANHLREREGIHLHLGSPLARVLDDGQGSARGVALANGREIAADLVILACGVRPNGELARTAGLAVDERGAILVDEHLRTSDPLIYAGGDCVSVANPLTGGRGYFPAGSLANRMGRVIGSNLAGGDATFPGAVGSSCVKIYGLSAARTGLTRPRPLRLSATPPRCWWSNPTAPTSIPTRGSFTSSWWWSGAAAGCWGWPPWARTATRWWAGSTRWPVIGQGRHGGGPGQPGALLLAPLGAAVDVLNNAAYAADNLLAGPPGPPGAGRVAARPLAELRAGQDAPIFLTCAAGQRQALPGGPGPGLGPPAPEELAARLAEVPRDREVVLVCKPGARSTRPRAPPAAGLRPYRNLAGGMLAARKWGVPLLGNGNGSRRD